MADLITREEFEARCAANRGETLEEFRAWLRAEGLAVFPCDCGYEGGEGGFAACRGWKVCAPDEEGVDGAWPAST